MHDHAAKLRSIALAERMRSAEACAVSDHGSLQRGCDTLRWFPVVPGSVVFNMRGVKWTTREDGSISDGTGAVVGCIDYRNGWFQFYEGFGVDSIDDYEAFYHYDVVKAAANVIPISMMITPGMLPL